MGYQISRLKKKDKKVDELQLLRELKRSKASLPVGADRGGLTFIKPEFLQWLCAIEESIKKHLDETAYRKYGKGWVRVCLPTTNVPSLNECPTNLGYTRQHSV